MSVILESGDLVLRPWRAGDAVALAAAHRDPEMGRWLMHSLDGEAEARRWIEAQAAGWASGERLSFAVVGAADRPVGLVAVKRHDPGRDSAEVGYWTAAEARGRGVAGRAVDAVSRWALGTDCPMPLSRLELLHAVDNEASCRVARRCGYELESMLPPHPPKFPAAGHVHVRRAPRPRGTIVTG